MDPRTKEATRREWRELGFFYDRDDVAKAWLITGSRQGLLRFGSLLREYVADPKNAIKSEHEHHGPYMYLKIMTWPEAGLDDTGIHGPLAELQRLAALVEQEVERLDLGSSIRISDEFVTGSPYSLVLSLQGEDFDPASCDDNLLEGVGPEGTNEPGA